MTLDPILAFYALPLLAIWVMYAVARRQEQSRAIARQKEASESGLDQPASLHPKIDPVLCIGCRACLNACPEGDILGLIGNKAQLIEASNCIGHGACKTACPNGAISLVFGTETRGIDLPAVDPHFQSNVPGLYIAGEIGGMGLIRNAVEQGRQAMEAIAARLRPSRSAGIFDVIIIGAGPAGISAGLCALEHGLRYLILEQDTLGGSVAHFPRGKVVMTQPANLPVIGRMPFRQVSKEKLLGFWNQAIKKSGLQIRFQERVEQVHRTDSGFAIRTGRATYHGNSVLLAIGRRGTPRKLDVPGEELSKVVYRLIDPATYRGKSVLIVGGGDSALEAAADVAEQPGTRVTLSYRGEAFSRAKIKNRERIERLSQQRRLRVILSSVVESISPHQVVLKTAQGHAALNNDAVIVCSGGILPTEFLRSAGVDIETKYGAA